MLDKLAMLSVINTVYSDTHGIKMYGVAKFVAGSTLKLSNM